ncbi:MAG: membrane fusion protein (multidrug efflux system) [Lentimonas sp.]|jgi:membrane fusion protein (multidrug efflux system)
MRKKISLGLILITMIGLLIAGLIFTKSAQFSAMQQASAFGGPMASTVSTFTVEAQSWEQVIAAVGSIQPVQGVGLEAEVAGLVSAIHFENGQKVTTGACLIELDVSVEQAQLRSTEANARLTEIEYERSKTLRESGSVTQSQLDRSRADNEKARAEVENLKAVINRKRICAPFDGELGIRTVNLGQYVTPGTPLVSLQAHERVYVNFTLPQHTLASLNTGLQIRLSSEVSPGRIFKGELTAISPRIDPITRTVEVQGTLNNPQALLRAGQFVRVEVVLPQQTEVTVVPSTAILYAPYGNSIFKLEAQLDEAGNEKGLVAKQYFIRIGERRGDFVSILEGLAAGETVVSAGAFKLRNNSPVVINNELAPEPKLVPTPGNS